MRVGVRARVRGRARVRALCGVVVYTYDDQVRGLGLRFER